MARVSRNVPFISFLKTMPGARPAERFGTGSGAHGACRRIVQAVTAKPSTATASASAPRRRRARFNCGSDDPTSSAYCAGLSSSSDPHAHKAIVSASAILVLAWISWMQLVPKGCRASCRAEKASLCQLEPARHEPLIGSSEKSARPRSTSEDV